MRTRGLIHFGATLLMLLSAGVASAGSNATVSVSATVLSKNQCKLSSGSATLAFGSIDAAGSTAATASTTIDVTCLGSSKNATFSLTQNGGLYSTGPNANRLRNTTVTTEYLPYTLSFNPPSATIATNTPTGITISGSILASDYANVYAGSYSDTVVITVNP